MFVAILAIFWNGLVWQRTLDCILQRETPLRPAEDPDGRLRTVHVVYSADRRGLPGVLGSMVSLTKHLAAPSDCVIHFIVTEEMLEEAKSLRECFHSEFPQPPRPEVIVHKLLPLPFNVSGITWGGGGGPGPIPQSWVRLFLPEYIPDAPRAIWLDCDILVKTDIAQLYRADMNATIMAVRDFQFTIADGFNSGMMLIDLERFVKEDRSGLGVSTFKRMYSESTGFADQDLLNVVFPRGHWHEIDWRWNAMGLGALFCDKESLGPHWIFGVQKWVFNWKSRVLHRCCWDDLKILHLAIGKKWWTRPDDVPNCQILAPLVQSQSCMGFHLHCQRTPGSGDTLPQ